MLNKFVPALTLVFMASAFAGPVRYVYQVVGTLDTRDGWTALQTSTGLKVFVRCSDGVFDDVTHDRVAGFSSTRECENFLAAIAKHASVATPAIVEITPSLGLELTVGL